MSTLEPDAQNRPLVTIITSTFNAQEHLSDLIASMRLQNKSGMEWIIVDGGSGDNTLSLANDARDVIDLVISEPDQGIYDAWNKGIRVAKGEWIAFMGADDYYLPNAFDSYRNAISDTANDVNLIVASFHRVDEADKRILRTMSSPWDWQKMQKWMMIGHPGTLHRRSLFARFGMFDTSLRVASDYDFLLRIGPYVRANFISTPLARVRIGGVSQHVQALKEAQQVRQRNLKLSNFQIKIAYSIARVKLFIRKWIKA